MRKYYKYFVYISVVALLFFLLRFDYFTLDFGDVSIVHLVLSVFLLWCGFVWDALCWWKVLTINDAPVHWHTAVVGHGLSIFGKYIPGKAWTVVGRASYVSGASLTLLQATYMSIQAQIIAIWVALILGLIPFIILNGFSSWSLILGIFLVGITVLLFSRSIQNLVASILMRITKRRFPTRMLTLKKFSVVVFWYAFYWILLMGGFTALVSAFRIPVSFSVALALPLAVTLGFLAFFFPAGIGVREGTMIGLLVLAAVPLKTATSVSIIARLWFLLGEIFVFCFAAFLRYARKTESLVYANSD